MKWLLIGCLGLVVACGMVGVARSQESNRREVRATIEHGDWYVVWGVTINEAEYARFTAAVASAVVTENPGPVMAYFEDLAQRNIDKMADQAPSVGRRAVRDLVTAAFDDPGRTIRRANLEVQAGIATYRRWYTTRVPAGTERYKIYGPYNPLTGKRTWTYGYRIKYEDRTVPLPNHHQPYIKFRILKPDTPPPVVQPITFWSYGSAQGGGYFQKSGNQWVEYKAGQYWATFQQVSATSNRVLLYDAGRNIEVRLDSDRAYWRYPGNDWNYLFHRQ